MANRCLWRIPLRARSRARHARVRRGRSSLPEPTSSVRGRGGAVAFSSAKFAVRGLAQSLAVELWPKGIHVAHVIVDGVIDTPQMRKRHALPAQEPLLKPEAIAEAYWNLIQQGRSAWSLEIDLRPNNEAFFE